MRYIIAEIMNLQSRFEKKKREGKIIKLTLITIKTAVGR